MLVLHRRNVPAFWVEARGETNWQLVTGCAWTLPSRGLIKGHRTETLHPDSFRRYQRTICLYQYKWEVSYSLEGR
jgi:hypothetical protein